jgi:hypothetical protein
MPVELHQVKDSIDLHQAFRVMAANTRFCLVSLIFLSVLAWSRDISVVLELHVSMPTA